MTVAERKIEEHPFEPFVPENATILILGSFPGMEQVKNKMNPEEWFYSAADNLFWRILSEAFSIKLNTVKEKKEFFSQKGIGIADIFFKIERKKLSNRDSALAIKEYNDGAIKTILEKYNIKNIFFTSKFVGEHFRKKFPDIQIGACLPSPSQAANIPISKSVDFKNYKQENPNGNTYSFRIFKYKQLLKS